MQTLKKGKLKLALAIVVLLLAVAVVFYMLHGADINTTTICNALIFAELPFALGIVLLVFSIRDIKDGKIEKQWAEKSKF